MTDSSPQPHSPDDSSPPVEDESRFAPKDRKSVV